MNHLLPLVEGFMAGKRTRPYYCGVVSEAVEIFLQRSQRGLDGAVMVKVQCDQNECQYIEKNEPPCPLTLDLFREEIQEREDQSRRRREQ